LLDYCLSIYTRLKSILKDNFISNSNYQDSKAVSQIWVRIGNQKQGLFFPLN